MQFCLKAEKVNSQVLLRLLVIKIPAFLSTGTNLSVPGVKLISHQSHHHFRMLHAPGLIPTRFITIVSHLVLLVTVLHAVEENVRACLPFEHTQSELNRKSVELSTGLGVALGLLGLELLGFLSGVSMFAPSAMLLSIAAHASATVVLTFFCLDEWDCDLYWWVFGLCSALPALVEVLLTIGVLGMKKYF